MKISTAMMYGWYVEVVGDDNIIWDEYLEPLDECHIIPDGIE